MWGTSPGDAADALDRLRHAGHELAVIQIVDPGEGNAGQVGEYEIEDMESGSLRTVIIDGRMAREYRARYENYQEAVRRYCRQHQIPLLQTATDVAVEDLLMRSLLEGGFVR